MPRQAKTPSCSSARASAPRAPARVVATVTMRVTPAVRARSMTSPASSPRCACVSITPGRSLAVGAAHPLELLLDDRVVELAEELARRLQRLSGSEVARLPASDPGRVVAGQDLVDQPVLVDLAELQRARDEAFVAEHLVHLLRGVREERREDRFQAVDRAQ